MSGDVKTFATKINRQRISSSLFDYIYLSFRHNANTFERFADQVGSSKRVLDAGCGFKPWLPLFDEATQYIGVDYSSQWSSADALASIDHLPFPDDTFDAVICSEVLEHTRYPERCIEELRRVCKPGGVLYISTPFAFPEHGIPYDFQRMTQYFYKSVFEKDEIVELNATSSTLATAFVTFNYFIESTPLRFAWGFKHIAYLIFNLLALASDVVINFAAPKIMRTLKHYTHMMPLGYNMIIRVRKP